jgi:hypothetical protein
MNERSRHRIGFAWLGACALAWLALPARAQTAPASHGYALNWVRAPGAEACISSSELAQRIEELIGPVFRAPDAADRAIEGLVAPATSGDGFAVHVRIAERDGESIGERAFESKAHDCKELNDSIVLVTVLMVDPSASERGLPAELLGMLDDRSTPGAELLAEMEQERKDAHAHVNPRVDEQVQVQEPAQVQEEREPVEAREPKEGRDSFGFDVAVVGALAYEVLPDLSPALGVNARLRTPAGMALQIGIEAWLPGDVAVTNDSGERVVTTFGATTADIAACLPIAAPGGVELSACAGAALVARWFESELSGGLYDRKNAQLGPIASVDARSELTTHLFALASVSMLAMLPGTSFSYSNRYGRQLLYEPETFGVYFALGAGARL